MSTERSGLSADNGPACRPPGVNTFSLVGGLCAFNRPEPPACPCAEAMVSSRNERQPDGDERREHGVATQRSSEGLRAPNWGVPRVTREGQIPVVQTDGEGPVVQRKGAAHRANRHPEVSFWGCSAAVFVELLRRGSWGPPAPTGPDAGVLSHPPVWTSSISSFPRPMLHAGPRRGSGSVLGATFPGKRKPGCGAFLVLF